MVTRPAVNIHQDFRVTPTVIVPGLAPLIIGPRYDVPPTKASRLAGDYVVATPTDFSYPSKLAVSVVKPTSVTVAFDAARLNYFSKTIGTGAYEFVTITGYRNKITTLGVTPSDELIFKSSTNSLGTVFTRSADFYDRDVKVGDYATVTGIAGGNSYTLTSKVAAIETATIAAAVSAPVANAGNQATQSHSVTISGSPVSAGGDTLTAGGTYTGALASGIVTDTYTVTVALAGGNPTIDATTADAGNSGDDTCTSSGTYNSSTAATYTVEVTTGGALLTAAITVTATNGDNSGPTVIATNGGLLNCGALGLKVAMDDGVDNVFTLGDKWTFDATPSTARLAVTSASGTDDVLVVPFPGFGATFNVGTRGVTASIADGGDTTLDATDHWDIVAVKAFAAVTATGTGTYVYTKDLVYTVTVVQSGPWNTCAISVTSDEYDASGPTIVTNFGVGIQAGTHGATITFATNSQGGLLAGDKFQFTASCAKAGAYKTLVLQNNLDVALVAGTQLTVTLALVQNDRTVGQYRENAPTTLAWSASTTAVTVNEDIELTATDWRGGAYTLPVTYAKVYIDYQALRPDGSTVIREITSTDDITAYYGASSVGNPLAYALTKTLANAGAALVRAINIESDDLAGYRRALELTENINNVYYFVPLTFDPAVHALLKTHCATFSTPQQGKWRRAFVCAVTPTELSLFGDYVNPYDGSLGDYKATIGTYPATPSAGNILVEAQAGQSTDFLASGVIAGDLCRVNYHIDSLGAVAYDTYTIAAVLTETTLLLSTGPVAAVTVASKFTVARPLTKEHQIDAMAAVADGFGDRRVSLIYPDTATSDDGATVPGYYLAAAIAGVKVGLPPHQPITNYALAGFTATPTTTVYFTKTQLDRLADHGVMIVAQEVIGGTPFIRQQLTTDVSQLEFQELSIGCNVDNISYYLRSVLLPYIGIYNINANTIAKITAVINGAVETLKQPVNEQAGPYLIDATLNQLIQDPNFKDQLRADLTATVPYPLNVINVHIVI